MGLKAKERRRGVIDLSDYFLLGGTIAVLIGGLLLWRMAAEVNAVLPGRVFLSRSRKDWSETRRLHKECFPAFPANATRIASHVTAAVGVSTFVIAIFLKASK
jgi:hypothetical protein